MSSEVTAIFSSLRFGRWTLSGMVPGCPGMGLVCGIPGAGCPGIGLVCGIPGAGCPGIVGCVSRGIGAIGPLGFVGPVDPPGVVCARSEFVPKPMLADNTAAVRVFFLFMFPPF